MAFYQFRRQQLLDTTVETLWNFISSPGNLGKITPKHMQFKIITPDIPEKMYEGMIIAYKIRLMPFVRINWVTEISKVEDYRYFVDEQLIGPYRLWHHEHILEPHEDGVLMTDIVSYSPPFGIIGKFSNSLFISSQLNAIFSYREKVLNQIFP